MNTITVQGKIKKLLIAYFAAMSALVQTAAQNYVMTETFIDSNNNSIAAIDYYDGLGRPVQSVVTGSNTSTGYEYRLQSYDYVDRIAKQFITAYGNGTPEFKDSANLSWLYSDVDKSTRYQYDGLGRVTTKRGPGNLWRNGNHYNQTAYRINSVGEVRLFSISGNSLKQTNNASHAQGTLTKDVYDDENGNEMRVYKDLYDRVVLERRINDNTAYDTYYVYDNLGNLRYVLPPMATDNLPTSGTWTMATSALKKYAYYYEYDSRGRCTKKQMPGCDYITMTYDNNDRLVASQDGNQRNASPVTSTYYEYDALGRQIVMGTKTAAGVKTPLLEAFYDDYTFISSLSSTDQVKMAFNPVAGYHSSYAGAKGLQTGTRIHLLNTPAVSYVTAIYYDLLGNVIQSRSTNNKNGTDVDYIQYNEYTGKQMNRRHVHSPSGQTEYTETYSYTYDYADRLLNVKHKLNSNAQVTLCAYTYDELGRVKTRQLMDNVETVTYDYNIRDWQKKISSTQFKEYIGYNETSGDVIPTNKYYNGNIGAIKWKTGNETKMRGYEFTYNDLNWMTNASYRENGSANNRYDVNYWYDKMGNMIYMERMGLQDGGSFGYIDDLVLDYNGNQVTHINDNEDDPTYSGAFNFPDGSSATIEYTYDQNGNMTKDLNKKISSIQYNLLNLPQNVTFQNGKSVSYSYNALGEKSEATYNYLVAGMNYTYCSNFCYENGTLKQILIDGGYISLNGTTPTYHYYLQDHLGNNRVVCNASGSVEQVNHYYPFGGLYGESTNESTQRYKYNGKEFDRIHGLDWYDYGARHMSPDIGRFISIDPMAEKYYNISPYAYCGSNPVNIIDPNGMDWVQRTYEGITEYYYDRNIKSQKDIDKKYGENSGIQYIKNNSSYELGGETFTFVNDTKDNKYGYVIKGSEKQDNDKILYGDNYTIFGTSDNSVNAETLHKNYLGTSYTGPNNPKDYIRNDSFQYIPRNRSEYGSYIHDKLYERAKAEGINGALFNTTPEVIAADAFLAQYNFLNMMNSHATLIDRGRSALTAGLFSFIFSYKYILNTFKK